MGDIHKDLPREDIIAMADRVVAGNSTASVYFKFTCAHCGNRCTFQEANTLFERGECDSCGKETVVDKAGFMLVFQMGGKRGSTSSKETKES